MTLTEFLLARIADRESVARDMQHQALAGRPFFNAARLAGGMGIRELIDPARVLADCEAKRRVIDAAWGDHLRIEGEWGMCRSKSELEAANDYPEAVTALALPYADHQDYREEWRA